MARKPQPTPAESLAELEKLIEAYRGRHITNSGWYTSSVTRISKPIRDGIFFYYGVLDFNILFVIAVNVE